MNERIKGLIHQMDRNGFPYQEGDCSMTVTHRDLEYFAELIIRECADLFDKDEIELSYTMRTIHNTIKEHFGVK